MQWTSKTPPASCQQKCNTDFFLSLCALFFHLNFMWHISFLLLHLFLRVSFPQHSGQPLSLGWSFLSMTSQRSISFALGWWETPFWHILCKFNFNRNMNSGTRASEIGWLSWCCVWIRLQLQLYVRPGGSAGLQPRGRGTDQDDEPAGFVGRPTVQRNTGRSDADMEEWGLLRPLQRVLAKLAATGALEHHRIL